jgi:hypothetical protein
MEIETLRSLLSYDPSTGKLTWIARMGPKAMPGSEAGRNDSGRYRKLQVQGKSLLAHRVAWALHYGSWPENQIDHLNGDSFDNRISNLRSASQAENMRNLRKHRAGKLFGAHLVRGKWHASFNHRGKPVHVGVFASDKEAHAAVLGYLKAKGWLEHKRISDPSMEDPIQ